MKVQRPKSSRMANSNKVLKINKTLSRPQTGRQNPNDNTKLNDAKKYNSNISHLNNKTYLPPLEVIQEGSKHKLNKAQELVQTQNFLKMQIHKLQDENVKLQTKSHNLNQAIKKIQKSGTNILTKNMIGKLAVNQKKSKQQMNVNLKKQLKNLVTELKCKRDDILNLKKNQKYSRIQEDEVMKLIMSEEIDRLKLLKQQNLQGSQFLIERIKTLKNENNIQHEAIDSLSQQHFQKIQQVQDQEIQYKQKMEELDYQINEINNEIQINVSRFQKMLELAGKKVDIQDILYCLKIENLTNEQIEFYNRKGFQSDYVDQTSYLLKQIDKQSYIYNIIVNSIDEKLKMQTKINHNSRDSFENMYQSRLSFMSTLKNINRPFFSMKFDHIASVCDNIRHNLIYYQVPYDQYVKSIEQGCNKKNISLDINEISEWINLLLQENEVFIGDEAVEIISYSIIDIHEQHGLDEAVNFIAFQQMIGMVEPYQLLDNEATKFLFEQLNLIYKLNKSQISNSFSQPLNNFKSIDDFFEEFFPTFHSVQKNFLINQIYMHNNTIYYLDHTLFQNLFIQEQLQASQLNLHRHSSAQLIKDESQEFDIYTQIQEKKKEDYIKQLGNKDIQEKINEQFFMNSQTPYYQNNQESNQNQYGLNEKSDINENKYDQYHSNNQTQKQDESNKYLQSEQDIQIVQVQSQSLVETKKPQNIRTSQEMIEDEMNDYEQEFEYVYEDEKSQDQQVKDLAKQDSQEEEEEEIIIEDDL